MPTQVHRHSSDNIPPRLDRYPSQQQQDHSPHDMRSRFNVQHREALRLALGSILTPKRPPLSHSSSGTSSPAYSFSGSASSSASGTYTPATPPLHPHTPSLDANTASEHAHPRHHYAHSHLHPHHAAYPPSKLGRMKSHSGSSDDTLPALELPPSAATTPPSSSSPSSRGSSHVRDHEHHLPAIPSEGALEVSRPLTAPLPPSPPPEMPAIHVSPVSETQSEAVTSDLHHHQPSLRPAPVPIVPSTQEGHEGAEKTPRAKFLQTLQSKSAWDALIHGSFS